MSSLRELQLAFARALDGDAAAARSLVVDGPLDADTRLGVYANNVRGTFRTALGIAFPAVRRLGGDAWFAGAANAYRRAHPSTSGDLTPAGAAFPAFLARELAGTPYAMLADVARLEWACEEAAGAADAPALDLDALARVPAEDHAALTFVLHPSCRLVASRWPIVDVWRANVEDASPDRPADAAIDPDAGPQRALVHREGLAIRVRELDAATYAFVEAMSRGGTLADALATAHACSQASTNGASQPSNAPANGTTDAAFDLGTTLVALARAGVFAGFR